MAPRLYATDDAVSSIRRAHSEFTHVLVNRNYATTRSVPFQSAKIDVEPVYTWADWEPASLTQVERWRTDGGVLLDRNWLPDKAGPTDFLLFVWCPSAMDRITRAIRVTRECVILPRPHTWRLHEEALDLHAPAVETLEKIWKLCRGQRMTDLELADATGIPVSSLQSLRPRLKPVNEWEIRPQLAPGNPALQPAWEWINVGNGVGRSASRKTARLAGHKAAIQEMVRLGHVRLTKYHAYPDAEPRWDLLERRRATALAELATVRALVDSIPDHLGA